MSFQFFSSKDPRRQIINNQGYGKNWPSQRKKALIRDSYTCQRCGHIGQKKGRYWDVSVHHIRKIKLFADSRTKEVNYESANDLSNLITLCEVNGCHRHYDGHQNKSGFKMLKEKQ